MRSLTAVAAVALSLCTTPAHAQGNEGFWVVMTSMSMPYGQDNQMAMTYIDSVMMPQLRANPNVTQAYVASGRYGASYGDVVMVTAYETFEAINAPCGAPCQEWRRANLPAEGSDGWDRFVAMRDAYRTYLIQAQRNVYWVPLRRSILNIR